MDFRDIAEEAAVERFRDPAGAVARGGGVLGGLGAVVAGMAEGRASDGEITPFDSSGLAIQDLAIALAALERADELDLPTLDL